MTTEPIELLPLLNRLKNTRAEIAYWKRQKVLRTNPPAKAQAGARVLIWESQLRVLNAELQALKQPTATR